MRLLRAFFRVSRGDRERLRCPARSVISSIIIIPEGEMRPRTHASITPTTPKRNLSTGVPMLVRTQISELTSECEVVCGLDSYLYLFLFPSLITREVRQDIQLSKLVFYLFTTFHVMNGMKFFIPVMN